MFNYSKAIGAVVGAVASTLAIVIVGGVSASEWVNVAIVAVTAAAVFTAPNVPGAKYTKSLLAVAGAVLVAANGFITDGITSAEGLQLLVAALTALGVYAIPNGEPGATE